MTNAIEMQRIMDMLAKVKHLAENAGTPGETAAASAMLQKMMVKHNLTMADIKDVNDQDSQEYDKHRFDLGGTFGWRKLLLDALAETNFCSAVFDHKGTGASIVGQQHNVTVIEHMYQYLLTAINRLADKAWATLDPFEKSMASARSWKNAFRVGAAKEIGARLRERHREAMAEHRATEAGKNSIMLVNDQLQSALTHYFPRLRSTSVGSASSSAGLAAGRAAGGGVNLDSQVGSGRMKPVLELGR